MDVYQVSMSILSICILIFVHELGHFLLAKWNKVGVLAFAIGFGPVLLKKKWGETVYSLRLFPLGGYVKMVGDDPRFLDPDYLPEIEQDEDEELSPDQKEVLEDRERWFLAKGYWAKFWIVFAGPLFNIIFAVFLSFSVFFFFGLHEPSEAPVLGMVGDDSPASKAGLQKGDRIAQIDGVEISSWDNMAETVRGSGGRELVLSVLRNMDAKGNVIESGEASQFSVSVQGEERPDLVSEGEERVFIIGIGPEVTTREVGFVESLQFSTERVYELSLLTVKGIWGMLSGSVSSDNIAGPIKIFQEAGKRAQSGLGPLLDFMMFLSISLGILNLLPIPILDGGHLVFFTLEAIKGSPMSLKTRMIANQIGLVLLLALMVFAISNDILN